MLLYSISDEYINYLKSYEKGVYTNSDPLLKKTRKYLGYVILVNSWKYYVPLSSPKKNDFHADGTIRKSIITIVRITDPSAKRLYGTLRISNMIPVPEEALVEYDASVETDVNYRLLVLNELSFIKTNQNMILQNANALYNEKIKGKSKSNYLEATLDFTKLESLATKWKSSI